MVSLCVSFSDMSCLRNWKRIILRKRVEHPSLSKLDSLTQGTSLVLVGARGSLCSLLWCRKPSGKNLTCAAAELWYQVACLVYYCLFWFGLESRLGRGDAVCDYGLNARIGVLLPVSLLFGVWVFFGFFHIIARFLSMSTEPPKHLKSPILSYLTPCGL